MNVITRAVVFITLVAAQAFPTAALAITEQDWPLYGGTTNEERYSPLGQIDRSTVSRLGLAFSFTDFVVRGRTHRGNEASPIVIDGVMYFTGPWSVVYAVDAKTGQLRWTFDPQVDGQAARDTCCDAVNRGVAVWKGIVYVASLDGFLISLDAKTGKLLWRVDTITDRLTQNYSSTGAPRIAGGNLVIGNSGAEMGARGYVTAYELATGKLAWRFFTVPGDPAKGPDESPDVTLARKTWDVHSRWDLGGGGTAWDSMVYDPSLNLLYIGVGNGCPHPAWIRSPGGGDNLFLSSIVAVDATSGRMRWYFQTTPKDSWDYTATQNLILADIIVGGRSRRVIMQAPKNGFFYVLDRLSGELLSARNYTTVTWANSLDPKSGYPDISPQADFSQGPKVIWPSQAGGHNWMPMSFSLKTKLVYLPVSESPEVFASNPVSSQGFRPGAVNEGDLPALVDETTDPALLRGQPKSRMENRLVAWDPSLHRPRWSAGPLPFLSGGTLATAGSLVFEGLSDGKFVAFDADTGKRLKEIETGTAIMAAPIAYEIDGVQYVAVLAGYGGAGLGSYIPETAPTQFVNSERLLVFKLDGKAVPMPSHVRAPTRYPLPQASSNDETVLNRGQSIVEDRCLACHGAKGAPGGYPDLWNLSAETHEIFEDILLKGIYRHAGMPSFIDALSNEDVHAVHAYLIADAATPPEQADQTKLPGPAMGGNRRPLSALPIADDISVPVGPGWLGVGFGSIWLSKSQSHEVYRIDPVSDRLVATIAVGSNAGLGIGIGLGYVWIADTTDKTLTQIDPRSNRAVQVIPVNLPDDSEGSIGVGAGAVWLLTASSDTESAVLTRLDPRHGRIMATIPVKAQSHAALVAFGSVWVSNSADGTVQRIDVRTNHVVAEITVSGSPRFMVEGRGSVWVMCQGDGSLARIDPRTNKVLATIPVGVPGRGGDLAFGSGSVWVSAEGTPVSRIDPASNVVTAQFVGGHELDTLRVGFNSAWLIDEGAGKLLKVRLETFSH